MTDISTIRAYELILLLLEARTDEADLFDSLLDETDSRELARTALSLATAVLEAEWGARAPRYVRELLAQQKEQFR